MATLRSSVHGTPPTLLGKEGLKVAFGYGINSERILRLLYTGATLEPLVQSKTCDICCEWIQAGYPAVAWDNPQSKQRDTLHLLCALIEIEQFGSDDECLHLGLASREDILKFIKNNLMPDLQLELAVCASSGFSLEKEFFQLQALL